MEEKEENLCFFLIIHFFFLNFRERLDKPFNDKLPHLYRLTVKPDNTFTIQLDHKVIKEGSLLQDFEPAVNPPHEIDDPNDVKPEDWDEREKVKYLM